MNLDNILLVIENDNGVEKNYIFENNAGNNTILKECGVNIGGIDSLIFNRVGDNYIAKICSDPNELLSFYNGQYNTTNDYKIITDKKGSNILKGILRPHYERKNLSVEVGDIIHNSNGHNYKLIDIFEKRENSMDALLVDVKNLEIVVARGLCYYDVKYGDINNEGALSESSFEWGHGIYYGSLNKETNMRSIYLDNLPDNKELQPRDIYEHRQKMLHEYISTKQIVDDKRFDVKIRDAAANVLANKFYNMDFDKFDNALMSGQFDASFKANTEKTKDKGGI